MSLRLFTSESVTEGHPDKIADQISDAVLDHILLDDPSGRVACETLVTTGMVLVVGEITTCTYVDIPDLARGILKSIGYTNSEYGIDGRTCAVLTSIDRQSGDIAQGVDRGGAGDQGMMFGFACDETETLMPAPIHYAHVLTRKLAKLRKVGEIPWLRPDGKAQVTVEYDGGTPIRIHTVVMSAQHDADVSQDRVREALREKVIGPALPDELFDEDD
ncbi:MAG: S-adenosylmethionine synthetase N-terminal domain-containing protein, partial [Gemmatimonadota bacterium]